MAEYESLNLAELQEEVERLDAQGAGNDFLANFVRMPQGDGFVNARLLPPEKGKKFFCATRTHRINNRSIHCPRVLVTNKQGKKLWCDEDPKNPCVVCKYCNELWKEAEHKESEGDKKAADELKTQYRAIKAIERYYYNCIVRSQVNNKGEMEKNVGPLILSIGKTLHDRIVRAIVGDPDHDEKPLGDVTDVKNGRDFKIIKKMRGQGKDSYPNYDDSKFVDPSPLGEKEQIENWMNSLHELSALRVVKTTDEIKLELKKHLGIIQNEVTSFDVSEFQKKPSLEEQVRQATHSVTQTVVDKPVPVDATLVEADFLAELKNM